LRLRDEIVEQMRTNFVAEFERTVTNLNKQLKLNQSAQLTSTVQVAKP